MNLSRGRFRHHLTFEDRDGKARQVVDGRNNAACRYLEASCISFCTPEAGWDPTKVEYGYEVALDGKTGKRTPLIVSSAPDLTVWLNDHPFGSDPQSPLWVRYDYEREAPQLRYPSIRSLLRRLLDRLGIRNRVYPHLFRHSRATFMVHGAGTKGRD